MADIVSVDVRSRMMSGIRGKNTKIEVLLRKALFAMGFRYRLHVRNLPGKPDVVLPKYAAVIFIHGCFWHGHKGCKYFVLPKTRTEWWQDKVEETIKRDRTAIRNLKELGWKPIIIWECELKPAKRNASLANIISTLTKESKIVNG